MNAFQENVVEVTLRFTVGKEPGDEEKPRVTTEYGSGCTVSANNTEECDTQKWHMKFNVKDTGSGLSSVSVRRPISTESLKYPREKIVIRPNVRGRFRTSFHAKWTTRTTTSRSGRRATLG